MDFNDILTARSAAQAIEALGLDPGACGLAAQVAVLAFGALVVTRKALSLTFRAARGAYRVLVPPPPRPGAVAARVCELLAGPGVALVERPDAASDLLAGPLTVGVWPSGMVSSVAIGGADALADLGDRDREFVRAAAGEARARLRAQLRDRRQAAALASLAGAADLAGGWFTMGGGGCGQHAPQANAGWHFDPAAGVSVPGHPAPGKRPA